MRRGKTNLRKILWGALFIQLLVLVTGFGIWTWLDFAEAEQEARKEVEASSLLLEEHVLRSLSAIDGALLQTADLVHEIGLKELHLETTWKRLKSIAKPLPRSSAIFIYGLNGDTMAASTSHPAPVFNASDREYFQHIVARKSDHYVGKALKGRTVHQFFFPVARPIKAADGQVQAVVQAGVEVDYIADLFAKAGLKGKAFGLYLMSDGALVSRHPMTEQLLDESIASLPFFSALSAGTFHWTGWVNAKKARQLATALRVSEVPLLLTVSMPYEMVFGHAYDQLLWRGGGLLAAVGILITFGAMLFKSISREEQSQNALRDANDRYELVLEGAQSGIWDWDVPRRKVSFSPVWKTMRGYGEKEISDNEEEWSRSIHPEDAPRVMAAVQAHLEGKTPVFHEEYRVQRKDGSWMWIADRGIAKRDATGSVVRMAGSETDITERKEAQAIFDRMRVMLAEGQKIAHVGSWEYLADTQTTVWSDEQCRIYGIDPAVGSPPYDVMLAKHIHPDDAAALHEAFSAALQNRAVYEQEHRIVGPDGGVRVLYERALPYFDENGKLIKYMGASLDITERKQAEEALSNEKARLSAILENLPVGVWIVDATGGVTSKNKAADQIWAEDAPFSSRPEDYIEYCAWDVEAGKRLETDDYPLTRTLRTGLPITPVELRIRRFNGTEGFIMMSTAPLRSPDGLLTGAVGINVDITARKQAEEELRQLNLSLEQRISERTTELAHTVEVLQEEISQRVRAENELKLAYEQLAQRADQLRRLASELTAIEQTERKRLSRILHDGLQQHLASAKMQLGGLAEQIENEDLKRTADEIEKVIGEGLSMSRSLNAELSPPILHEGGLSEGLEWLMRRMREKHRFSVDLALGAAPELREDVKILVFESVRELLFNALKHAQASRAQVRLELVGEAEMQVTVSDEGVGFDPCRLLPAGDGGGFGLFSIRERVGLLGGRLEIDSAPGRGSRVALTVPHGKADAARFLMDDVCAPALLPPRGAAEDQKTTIRVLLVDDHALFRKGIARLLKNEPGLEVVGEAKDGQEAIEFAQKHMPNVILMDISMPGVNGIEATRVIHERHPEVCIIGLSMYDDPEKERAMRAAGATDYRTKGCARAELIAAIRAGLQTRKPSSKLKLHTNNQNERHEIEAGSIFD